MLDHDRSEPKYAIPPGIVPYPNFRASKKGTGPYLVIISIGKPFACSIT
jgi:hypothetical protein